MQQTQLSPDALAIIDRTHLERGKHTDPEDGMCAMELVAFVAGEPFSDHPKCVCPILGVFVRRLNDGLPDGRRDEILKPILPRLFGTNGSKALSARRALMAADWLVRVNLPAWLRLAKLDARADALAALPEITALGQLRAAKDMISSARVSARSTAEAAVVYAAAAVATYADTDAYDAAYAVASGAAAACAYADTAYAADADAIRETLVVIQRSGADLLSRMIDAREAA